MIMITTVTGVVLAGGRGQRMGEADKGLQPLRGRSLVEWVLERVDPQVDDLLIIANRNLERYLELGYPVLRDRIPDFAGPLAGLQAGLTQTRSELVLLVPCDTPLLPADLVSRLAAALRQADAEVANALHRERVARAEADAARRCYGRSSAATVGQRGLRFELRFRDLRSES